MAETVYFKPASSQPYHIMKAATWLTALGKFNNKIQAYNYLVELEDKDRFTFKYLMSEYHRVHSFKAGYLVYRDDSNAFRSAIGPYGEESHMYY